MSSTIHGLRSELFETLQLVKKGEMELEKAKVIVQIGQAIINSAKVEVDFVKAINASQGSGFIPLENKQ